MLAWLSSPGNSLYQLRGCITLNVSTYKIKGDKEIDEIGRQQPKSWINTVISML